jgi:2-polyprenyl-3-methyl-5-hydroxy-6-metoxy-1,4-benzoquinol methylase
MDTQSPLTGNIVATPIARYPSTQLVRDWEATFDIDIGEELRGVHEVRKYRCPESGLNFFTPEASQGSDALYKALGQFSWYYAPDKWEYHKCLEILPLNQKILEVGCGSGRFLELAQAKGHDVRGLDINAAAVEAAKEGGFRVDCEELHEYAQDREAEYDCLCAFQLLEHLQDSLSFLQDALRVLKPGGLLVLATPNAESFLRYQYTLLDLPPHHMAQWSLQSYRFLETVLPVSLQSAFYEPLAQDHVVHYAHSTSKHISQRFKVGSKLVKSLVRKSIGLACSMGLRRCFRGQCMLVVFQKKSDGVVSVPTQEVAKRYANVGCGSTCHPDWENYDLVPRDVSVKAMDIVQGWTIAPKSYDAIYCSHVLEHLKRNQTKQFLINCYNSLKPGGVLRLVVPDLEGICREYLQQLDAVRSGEETAKRRHQWMTLELLDQMVRTSSGGAMAKLWASGDLPEEDFIIERLGEESAHWIEQLKSERTESCEAAAYEDVFAQLPDLKGEKTLKFREGGEIHQWMYDEVSLSGLLSSLGFECVVRRAGLDSSIPNFKSYNLDTNASGIVRKPDSLFIECMRKA